MENGLLRRMRGRCALTITLTHTARTYKYLYPLLWTGTWFKSRERRKFSFPEARLKLVSEQPIFYSLLRSVWRAMDPGLVVERTKLPLEKALQHVASRMRGLPPQNRKTVTTSRLLLHITSDPIWYGKLPSLDHVLWISLMVAWFGRRPTR